MIEQANINRMVDGRVAVEIDGVWSIFTRTGALVAEQLKATHEERKLEVVNAPEKALAKECLGIDDLDKWTKPEPEPEPAEIPE